jgi:hypothetical protein
MFQLCPKTQRLRVSRAAAREFSRGRQPTETVRDTSQSRVAATEAAHQRLCRRYAAVRIIGARFRGLAPTAKLCRPSGTGISPLAFSGLRRLVVTRTQGSTLGDRITHTFGAMED